MYERSNKERTRVMWNDITHCTGDGCPLAENCFRYYLHINSREGLVSIFASPPIQEDGCKRFMNLKEWKE